MRARQRGAASILDTGVSLPFAARGVQNSAYRLASLQGTYPFDSPHHHVDDMSMMVRFFVVFDSGTPMGYIVVPVCPMGTPSWNLRKFGTGLSQGSKYAVTTRFVGFLSCSEDRSQFTYTL